MTEQAEVIQYQTSGTCCQVMQVAIKDGKIDLGKCTFCLECERICPNNCIKFTTNNRMGAINREDLITNGELNPIKVKEEIKRVFGRSLKLRQVSAGGCNACEMELNATGNANFDLGRYGIEFVAFFESCV